MWPLIGAVAALGTFLGVLWLARRETIARATSEAQNAQKQETLTNVQKAQDARLGIRIDRAAADKLRDKYTRD